MRSLIIPGIGAIRRRDPRLALYPFALDDASAGVFRDLMTNVDATTSGGSTLTGAAKRRNDYQRLTSTFPSLGYRASGAVTNLLYALNPDNTSFENGTVGGWTTIPAGNIASATVSQEQSWHGSYSTKLVQSAADSRYDLVITAVTANAQYTASAMFKAPYAGDAAWLQLHGNASGGAVTVVTTTGDWQQITVTHTFAGDVTRSLFFYPRSGAAGYEWYLDAISLVAGATVPQFEEKEVVATSATFPTPFSAGEPFSAAFYVFSPWPGDDGALHTIFDSQGTGAAQNRILIQKTAANNLEFNIWDNATNLKQCSEAVTAVNWPAGTMKRVTISRDAGVMNAFLNGVVFGTLNAGAGTGLESALGANSYIGTDNAGANPLNGLILPYIYRGVAWGDAECEYYSTLQAPPPRTRMVA